MTLREWLAANPGVSMNDLWSCLAALDPPTTEGEANPSRFIQRHRDGSDGMRRPSPEWIDRYQRYTKQEEEAGRCKGIITAQDWQDQHYQPSDQSSEAA